MLESATTLNFLSIPDLKLQLEVRPVDVISVGRHWKGHSIACVILVRGRKANG